MNTDSFKDLIRAESIIQRDAILAALRAAGLDPISPPRDISRKIADTTVDFSYQGYSAMFDGFVIRVPESQLEQAQSITRQVLTQAQQSDDNSEISATHNINRFYFCCLFSLGLPLIMHLLAIHHLRKALAAKEPMNRIGVFIGCLWLILTVLFIVYFMF